MIKTERLELVDFDVKYANDLFKLWSDFEVIKYTYTPLMTTIDLRISRADKYFKDTFIILFNKKAIGMIGCPAIDKEKSKFGLYYQLSRAYWKCGYASEAANAIKCYLLNNYPNAVIKVEAVSTNPASMAVLEKIGLRQTHTDVKGFKRNNFELDLINFSNV